MPALSCIKAPRSRLNISAEGPSDAEHHYTVTCTPRSDEFDVLNARNLPRLGQPHPKNRFLTVANHALTQRSTIFWDVLVQYALPAFDLDAGNNPLLQAPVVNFDVEKWEEEVSEDINGTPFENVMGEPIDVPVFRRFSERVAVIEKNVSQFNQWDWEETVNTDWFMGAPPGYALLEEVTASFTSSGGFSYYTRRARVHFRKSGWRISRVHTGFKYYKRFEDGVVRVVKLAEGTTVPTFLTANGFQADIPSRTAKPPFYNNVSYLTWDLYRRGSLNRMRLFG